MVGGKHAIRTSEKNVWNEEEEEERKAEKMRRKNRLKINRAQIMKKAILIAEDLFPEPKSGSEKKAFVVDFINERVNLPLLNERQEEKLIGFAVDVLCELIFEKANSK